MVLCGWPRSVLNLGLSDSKAKVYVFNSCYSASNHGVCLFLPFYYKMVCAHLNNSGSIGWIKEM